MPILSRLLLVITLLGFSACVKPRPQGNAEGYGARTNCPKGPNGQPKCK